MKNPAGFVQIINASGELCACFGILGLKHSFTEQFLAGNVSDTRLSADDVLPLEKARGASSLYISGVVVRDSTRHTGHKRAGVMLWCMLHYMKTVYGLRKARLLYAVAVNRKSEQMMKNFGFRLLDPKERRIDKCPLYGFSLTKNTWVELMRHIPDYSRMCECDFQIPRSALGSRRSRRAPAERPVSVRDPNKARSTITILFVAGDRGGSRHNQVQIPREFDRIQAAIRGAEHRDTFAIATPIQATTHLKLTAAYRGQPTVLHFAGHGDDRSLSLLLDQDLVVTEAPIVAEELVKVLGSFPKRIRLCVLNACESDNLARRLVDEGAVDSAIGWSGKVSDANAIAFAEGLYRCLADGLAISQAVTLAAAGAQSTDPPGLYTRPGVDPTAALFTLRT
jgi:hypothetical protein